MVFYQVEQNRIPFFKKIILINTSQTFFDMLATAPGSKVEGGIITTSTGVKINRNKKLIILLSKYPSASEGYYTGVFDLRPKQYFVVDQDGRGHIYMVIPNAGDWTTSTTFDGECALFLQQETKLAPNTYGAFGASNTPLKTSPKYTKLNQLITQFVRSGNGKDTVLVPIFGIKTVNSLGGNIRTNFN